MRRLLRHRPAPALVLASTALLLALAGGSIAAVSVVPNNSVGTPQLKKNAVISGKIKNGEVTSGDIKNTTIASADIKDGTVASPDIANGTITATDVKDHSLLAIDFQEGQIPGGAQGPPGPQGPPGVSGLERRGVSTASNSGAPKALSAVCPAGKRVIGGGAAVTGSGASQVSITASFPDENGTKWNARAVEADATGENWVLTAYSLCANVSS